MKAHYTILLYVVVVLCSCESGRTDSERETALLSGFRKMDSFLRNEQFAFDSLKVHLANMENDFVHAETRAAAHDQWQTTVTYKWSADSTITCVDAYKAYPKGFSRERIIHAGDSLLFLHRFSTQPLGQNNPGRFTFLESIFYLNEFGTIKHLERIEYDREYLKDTLSFRRTPFADLTDEVSHYYSLELDHCRNLLVSW